MMGVQGLYNDGWMLSAVPVRAPWELLGKAIPDPASAFKFELYDVRHDWTQYTDVAAANPGQGAGDDGPDVRASSPSIRCCRWMPRSRRAW